MSALNAFNTRAQLLPSPGMVWGRYPQRRTSAADAGQGSRWKRWLAKRTSALAVWTDGLEQTRLRDFADRTLQGIPKFSGLSEADLAKAIDNTRARIAKEGLSDALSIELTAGVACVCARTLGKTPYPVQLMAVRTLLDNALAQMQTGEGKTLAVGLAAAIAALAGVPVLVITANDYLVERDRALMLPMFEALGISSSFVVREHEPEQRRAAYATQLCYCTAKELGFDYLRDQASIAHDKMELSHQIQSLVLEDGQAPLPTPMLRGLCMAIIDEADSILLDEAVTPLILSRAVRDEAQLGRFRMAMNLARQLWPKTHYAVDGARKSCTLNAEGKACLARLCTSTQSEASGGHLWTHQRFREELVCLALAALNLYQRDRDYVVRDGELKMIDQPTGRVAEGRKWSRGIHQLLELKEKLEPTDQTETMAQISFQRLFPRFLRLSGVSGSLVEARAELRSIYGLKTISIPLNRPSQRKNQAPELYAHSRLKWQRVIELCVQAHARGQPILLGTDSVASSRHLSALLRREHLEHKVLTAAQDADEANIVAEAGQRGAITITTNLAGRGTDILIRSEVEALGGLVVISSHLNAERRIDRQLIGRCARQGQPGSSHTIVSLDDPLFIRTVPHGLDRILRNRLNNEGRQGWTWLIRMAQWIEESRASRQRLTLLENQILKERMLAMAGKSE